MASLTGTLFTALLACLVTAQCYVALEMGAMPIDLSRRGLLHEGDNYVKHTNNKVDNTTVIRGELIHRDHPSSPLSPSTPKPFSERIADAVKRSLERRDNIARNIKATVTGLQSPVSAGNNEYVMEISIGTPPQKFSAIVDTGSDLVWVQCLPCTSCYQQTGPKFEPKKSKTYKGVGCNDSLCQDLPSPGCGSSCEYTYQYGDFSSTAGDFAYETVTLGGPGIPKVAFGCGHDNHGTFAGVGGLVGLGRGPISLPSQLSSSSGIKNIFSYCLVSSTGATTTTSPIFFGDVTPSSGILYTPLISNRNNPSFYYVAVNGISVGGQDLSIPAGTFDINSSGNGGVILDSGTTLTFLAPNAYDLVKQAFQGAITYPTIDGSSYALDLCYDVAQVSKPTFPTVVVHFANVDYTSPPENTFLFMDNAKTIICLAMLPSQDFSVIGNVLQQDHQFVYDVVNKQVGFAAVQCNTL